MTSRLYTQRILISSILALVKRELIMSILQVKMLKKNYSFVINYSPYIILRRNIARTAMTATILCVEWCYIKQVGTYNIIVVNRLSPDLKTPHCVQNDIYGFSLKNKIVLLHFTYIFYYLYYYSFFNLGYEYNCALAIKFAITINIYYLRYWKLVYATLSRARGLSSLLLRSYIQVQVRDIFFFNNENTQ